ncbi:MULTISPECIES: YncE family protein [unclassified Halomonas]|uniref:YncE family protein n=2 Tax=Halomonadaceae TaxID=28256 RepID=UPI00209F8F24|nr:YncE family protein [Halomonas sp. Y3]
MSIRFSSAATARQAFLPSSLTLTGNHRLLGWLMAAGLALSTMPTLADAVPAGTVVTANERGASLTHINLSSGGTSTHAMAIAPHNVQISDSGRYLMAVGEPAADDHGHGHDGGHAHGDAPGKLKLYPSHDPSGAPLASIDVGSHPAHVVSDREGRFAFVTNAGDNSVSVVDLEAKESVATIATGEYPHGLRLSPDGQELYVANVLDGSVSIIDVEAREEVARLPVGQAPVQVGFTPDGTRVFVSLRDENRVAVIDTNRREVVERIEVGRLPIQVHATPDGRYMLVANEGTEDEPDNRVSVIALDSLAVVATHEVGAGAHGVSVDDSGRFAFVTSLYDDSLSVIDLEAGTVISRYDTGQGPNGVTWVNH